MRNKLKKTTMAKMTVGTLLWKSELREYLQPWLELYPISAEEVPPKLFKSQEPAYQDVHVLRPSPRPSDHQKCSAFPRNDDRIIYFDGILSTRPRFCDPRAFLDNGPPAKLQFRLRILALPPLHQTTSLDVLAYLPTRPPSIAPRSLQFLRARRLNPEELLPPQPKSPLIDRVNKKVTLWSLPSHNRGFDLENHGLMDATGQPISALENANVICVQQRSHDAHSMAECRLLARVNTDTPKDRDKPSPPSVARTLADYCDTFIRANLRCLPITRPPDVVRSSLLSQAGPTPHRHTKCTPRLNSARGNRWTHPCPRIGKSPPSQLVNVSSAFCESRKFASTTHLAKRGQTAESWKCAATAAARTPLTRQ